MKQPPNLPKELDLLLAAKDTHLQGRGRPWVTLSYAQSLDGSIAAQRGSPLSLSGSATLKITHVLRAKHSAILIGIGTLLADDPQLNVRLVSGANPQPVVLDRQLRFPLNARLLRGQKPPWIFTTRKAQPERKATLEKAGARVFRVDAEMQNIREMLSILGQEGIASIMVEGGAGVITSFLQTQVVDLVVLTLTARLVGGLSGVESRLAEDGPRLDSFGVERFDEDLLVWGIPRWASGVT